jgi:hypothetical protein
MGKLTSFIQIILKNSIHTSQKKLHFHYKAQPVDAVSGYSRCFLRESCGTYIHCRGGGAMLKAGGAHNDYRALKVTDMSQA